MSFCCVSCLLQSLKRSQGLQNGFGVQGLELQGVRKFKGVPGIPDVRTDRNQKNKHMHPSGVNPPAYKSCNRH